MSSVTISTSAFEIVKSEDGAVVVATIRNIEHIRQGTRSEQVHYNVYLERVIYGNVHDIDLIKHYGDVKMEIDKQYLIFLRGARLYSLIDFQDLGSNDLGDIVDGCIEKFRMIDS